MMDVGTVDELRALAQEMRVKRREIAVLQDALVDRFMAEISLREQFAHKGKQRVVNGRAWVVGVRERDGFRVRHISWDYNLAQQQRQDDEEVRPARIDVAHHGRRKKS